MKYYNVSLSIAVIVGLLILVCPFFYDNNLISPTQTGKFFLFGYAVLLIMLLRLVSLAFQPGTNIISNPDNRFPGELLSSTSSIDVVLAFWFLCITIRVLLAFESYGVPMQYYELCGLTIIYCIIRGFNKAYFEALLCAMMGAGIAQAIYGQLQVYRVLPSHHQLFKLTGGFFNPGHLGGYLAVIFPIALSFQLFKPIKTSDVSARFGREKIIGLISLISFISILLIMPATRSRAAWVAMLVSSGYLLSVRYDLVGYALRWSNSGRRKFALVALFIGVVSASALGLYVIKKESANGRLLIWKVSAGMIKDRPLLGFGYDRFKANYLNYQEQYFRGNRSGDEAINADDSIRAFNEYIEIVVENGMVGLLLLAAASHFIFIRRQSVIRPEQNGVYHACKAGILSFAVFACFSYPSEILPLKLSLMVCVAYIAKEQKSIQTTGRFFNIHYRATLFKSLRRSIAFAGVLGAVWCAVQLTKSYQYNKSWKRGFSLYQKGLYKQSLNEYQQIYSQLRFDGDYLTHYGKACSMAGQHERAIQILTRAGSFFPNSTINTALGDSYKAVGNYGRAEQAYLKAARILPDTFYPKYLLVKLYVESGENSKALEMANELINKVPKVKSMAVDEIKQEMRSIVGQFKSGSS